MILSDSEIHERLERDLVIRPLLDPELQVQPASVDLRLGNQFLIFKTPHIPFVDPADPVDLERYTEELTIADGEVFILHPGEFALASTLEWVEIPADLTARVEGRSSLGRLAVVVHATAGFIDPGFCGRITLELSNLGRIPVALRPGMRISQIVLHQLGRPARRPYGLARGSKYQAQSGPVASRIDQDFAAPAASEAREEEDQP